MATLFRPLQVKGSALRAAKSLSPANFVTVSVAREKVIPLQDLLLFPKPYIKGIEPGGTAYVTNSQTYFVRNSCVDQENFSQNPSKYVCLNPTLQYGNRINTEDILICKDANIGDCCLFIPDQPAANYLFSSGIAKLYARDERKKFYLIAAMRDSYFRAQLDAKTPRGSTIRHSGDRFLTCFVPELRESEDWVYGACAALVRNIAYAERGCIRQDRTGNGSH
jgi:hypothetical protein